MRIDSRRDETPIEARRLFPSAFFYGRVQWEVFGPAALASLRSVNPLSPGHQIDSCWPGSSMETPAMFMHEPARADTRPFDLTQLHYAIGEDAEFHLRMLVEALRTASALCTAYDPDSGGGEVPDLAPLFHVCAEFGARLVAEFALVTPGANP